VNGGAHPRLAPGVDPGEHGGVTRRRLGLEILAGLACFGLGVGAARLLGPAPVPPVAAGPALGTGPEPRIVIDPASVDLLPDASLRLVLPPGFDAGAP
jgi:hypothetical protein